MSVLLALFVIVVCLNLVAGTLLYPASSVLQLTSSVSVPIADLPPRRSILFDWGIQMNYNMPFNLSSFYMVPIWASSSTARLERDTAVRDITTAEFLEAMEIFLERYGFHRTCLKRSICELAHHPFDESDRNLLTDFMTFVMTPSLMLGYSWDESINEYHQAESHGFAGQPCHQLYRECLEDPLTIVTMVISKED